MVGKYWINTPCYFNMVSFTGSNSSDTWAGNEQVIVLQLTKWKWQSSNM